LNDRFNAKTNVLFLSVILVVGTFASITPSSSFITEVYALSDFGLKEDNNYKAKYLPYKKDDINCNNINLNVDGGLNSNNKNKLFYFYI
jgi:hypothetical protein